jgi:hypothetical protein
LVVAVDVLMDVAAGRFGQLQAALAGSYLDRHDGWRAVAILD